MLSEEEVVQRKVELEERRELKRAYRRRQVIIYSVSFIVAIILMVVTAFYVYQRGLQEQQTVAGTTDRLLVLFLGTDEKLEASTRADSIMLFSLDTTTGEVGVLSIPRDTRVWIPSRQRWERVNAAYAHGGASMALEAVSSLLRMPVNYYVHTDFAGFEQLVDVLGGVEVNVARRMQYVDKAGGLEIDLRPGLQVLNGQKALQYVRYRDRLGDVSLVDPFNEEYDGRVERQRQFFEAVVSQTLSPSTIVKLPQLVTQVFRIIDTNLPWDRVLSLAMSGTKFSADKMQTAVLPGNSQVLNEAWYWVVNEAKAKAVIDTVIYGKPEPLKLVVLNGNGRSGVAQEVADLLSYYGYDVVSHGNAEHFNFTTTQVVVSARDAERVKPLADYLGASIQQSEEEASQVTVIIGQDYSSTKERSVGI
ncbi:MAG: LCP family protein [Limnochordia bacterium]|jgi:LCP family protein required for cell wall assembly|nr:LCP family protein [Limnochordia bacterium]